MSAHATACSGLMATSPFHLRLARGLRAFSDCCFATRRQIKLAATRRNASEPTVSATDKTIVWTELVELFTLAGPGGGVGLLGVITSEDSAMKEIKKAINACKVSQTRTFNRRRSVRTTHEEGTVLVHHKKRMRTVYLSNNVQTSTESVALHLVIPHLSHSVGLSELQVKYDTAARETHMI